MRAVQSLGLADANVNERNDLCVGKFKIGTPLRPQGTAAAILTMLLVSVDTSLDPRTRSSTNVPTTMVRCSSRVSSGPSGSSYTRTKCTAHLPRFRTMIDRCENHFRTLCKPKAWHPSARPSATSDNTSQTYHTKTSCTPSCASSRTVTISEKP